MATPLTDDALLRILRQEGLTVKEVRDWRTHNRNHKGKWGPVSGILVHHTVTSGAAQTVDICYDGHATLPGPLCQGVITKDGTVHLVSSGRSNHAGGGDSTVLTQVIAESYGARPSPPQRGNADGIDGNARFYGFECENLGNGKDPWPEKQLAAIEKACAAICRHYGWSEKSVIGHLEWSNDKIDPRGFSMQDMRSRVEKRLSKPAGEPSSKEDEEMPLRTSLGKSKTQAAKWNTWTQITWDKEYADPEKSHADGNYPGYVAPESSWADFNGTLTLSGMQDGDRYLLRYEVHDWKNGKSAGQWDEIIWDLPATPGEQFLSIPWSKGLSKGQHVYVAICPQPEKGREKAASPKVTSGRWSIRQDQ